MESPTLGIPSLHFPAKSLPELSRADPGVALEQGTIKSMLDLIPSLHPLDLALSFALRGGKCPGLGIPLGIFLGSSQRYSSKIKHFRAGDQDFECQKSTSGFFY